MRKLLFCGLPLCVALSAGAAGSVYTVINNTANVVSPMIAYQVNSGGALGTYAWNGGATLAVAPGATVTVTDSAAPDPPGWSAYTVNWYDGNGNYSTSDGGIPGTFGGHTGTFVYSSYFTMGDPITVTYGPSGPTTTCHQLDCINMDSRPWNYNVVSNLGTGYPWSASTVIDSVNLPPGGQYHKQVCVSGSPPTAFQLILFRLNDDGTYSSSTAGDCPDYSTNSTSPGYHAPVEIPNGNGTNPIAPIYDQGTTNIVWAPTNGTPAQNQTMQSGFSAVFDATAKQTASEHADSKLSDGLLSGLDGDLNAFKNANHTDLSNLKSSVDAVNSTAAVGNTWLEGANIGINNLTNSAGLSYKAMTNGFAQLHYDNTNGGLGDVAGWTSATNTLFGAHHTDGSTVWSDAAGSGEVGTAADQLGAWAGDGSSFSSPGDSDLGPSGSGFNYTIAAGSTVGGTPLSFHFGSDGSQAWSMITDTSDLSHKLFTWILCLVYVMKVGKDIYSVISVMASSKGATVPNLNFEVAGFGGNIAGPILYLAVFVGGMAVWAIFLAAMFTSATAGELNIGSLFSTAGAHNPIDGMNTGGLALLCMYVPIGLLFGLAAAYVTWRFTVTKLVLLFLAATKALVGW